MPRPETPDTQSSSPGGTTPGSHPHSTPPTDPKIFDMGIARLGMNAGLQQFGTPHNESPSLRGHRVWPNNFGRAQDMSPSPPVSGIDPWSRLSSESSKTLVPPRSHPAGTSINSYAPSVGSNEQQESAHQSRIAQFVLQTPSPSAPIRQPAAPPADHFASANARQDLDPAVWEGLSRFSRLSMNESPVPRRAQVPESSQQAQFPVWGNQGFNDRLSSETVVYQAPSNQQQTSPPRGFRPMAAISHVDKTIGTRINPREVSPTDPRAFSSNYRGEHSARNASVDDLPFEQNCALWLTNLPPDVTHQQLLSQIRNIGRIWCTVINAPDYDRHNTAAAKVVFFTPAPAQRLLQKSLTQGLEVNGYGVKVTHNRVKYGSQTLTGNASRVLIVTGKTTFVNPESLTEFFKARFVFEVDEIIELIVQGNRHKGGRSVVEYRFGSFRCQAQMGKMALEKDRPEGFEKVDFGPDPCEVGDNLASYGIAAQRIQGMGI
ncbi:hypothetical protein ACHAPT_004215 [Fusarium lateritium]